MHAGKSEGYQMDRGLREGGPSSPPIFNVYHCAVMQDFRARRAIQAAECQLTPGIPWTARVDGRLHWTQVMRNTTDPTVPARHFAIGDVIFADDTTILAEAEESEQANRVFRDTMTDWRHWLNAGK